MRKTITLFISILFVFSCAPKSVDTSDKKQRAKPKISVTEVVQAFLSALKDKDYHTAYDYTNVPTVDREGFVSASKARANDSNLTLLDYRITGTSILGEIAYVDADVTISYYPSVNSELVKVIRKIKIKLSVFEGEWKITETNCIENCELNGVSK